MTKLRMNHQRGDRSGFGKLGIRVFLFFAVVIAGFVYLYRSLGQISIGESQKATKADLYYLPDGGNGEFVSHTYFNLSYIEKHEQAEWVAYELTKSSLQAPNVDRHDRFNTDPLVSSKSAHHKDYSNSGYSRGHLAPAGDMAFSETAMRESFYMSNMSPQLRNFNGGIWRELEENVRDWAYTRDKVIVITGPILNDHLDKKIGKNRVTVPNEFYKIILDPKKDECVAFIIPNKRSDRQLTEYQVSINRIEELTQLDFFKDFYDDKQEEEIESKKGIGKWVFDNKRFRDRINKWNKQ